METLRNERDVKDVAGGCGGSFRGVFPSQIGGRGKVALGQRRLTAANEGAQTFRVGGPGRRDAGQRRRRHGRRVGRRHGRAGRRRHARVHRSGALRRF